MKTTRHSLMAKGIIVLLSLLVLVFAFSYSWFAPPNRPVNASGLTLAAESSGDFEYAIGFYNSQTLNTYKYTNFTNESTALNLENLQASDGVYYNLLHDYVPIDVTGDGATLIRPSMLYGNSSINTESVDYSIADPNVQYVNFDLFFRSKVRDVSIKLGDGSYAIGACELNTGTKTDAGRGSLTNSSLANSTYGYNQSTYGSFSKDAIVGAVRVAFVPYLIGSNQVTSSNLYSNTPEYLDSNSSNTTLWLPRPDFHANANDTTTGWTLSAATYPASYSNADATHTYYNIFKNLSDSDPNFHKVVNYSGTVTPSVLANESQEFTSISSTLRIGEYYYTKVNVRIWIEGTDIESRRAFSGGRFAVNFKFTTK